MQFVYDDTVRMPKDIRDMVGQKRFGDLMDGGQALVLRLRTAAEAVGMTFLHLRSQEDAAEAAQDARDGVTRDDCIIWPARLAPASAETAVSILQRCRYLDSGTRLRVSGSAARILLVSAEEWARVARAPEDTMGPDPMPPIELTDPLFDLAEAYACTQFLSGAFKTRHFNDILRQGHTITKRSKDRRKMRAEHDFYYLLPPEFQRFFVQPYGFTETELLASYEMERLAVPDMSVLWTHHAFSPPEFSEFLDRAFDFLERRPRQPAQAADLTRAYQTAHTAKLEMRAQALEAWSGFSRFNALLSAAVPGGYRGLIDRWVSLRATIAHPDYGYLAIGHGDFCLSNILYDKRSGIFKLIDPKGATRTEDLWVEPGYDLAKLSHSILGGYDFVVKGIARAEISEDMSPQLGRTDFRLRAQQDMFLERVLQRGIDWKAIRIDEACLFLSMLVLHTDAPGRVLSLALTAHDILRRIEANTPFALQTTIPLPAFT